MKTYKFKGILQNDTWKENCFISVDENGIITSIASKLNRDEMAIFVDGYALPGFQNAHSHAFQYAMAGIAENRTNKSNDFWGWREAMYELALKVNPQQMYDIASMLYAEMVNVGYTNVAEFHYLHHDLNGRPFTNIAEMGSSLIEAAKTAGINITLIPIFYQNGGFGIPANDSQRRFLSSDSSEYMKLLESSQQAAKNHKHATIGIGVHSLRGVEADQLKEIYNANSQNLPFHLHVSEQMKEVNDAVDYLGKRPVEWLLSNLELDENIHLVHATHLSDNEVEQLGRSKANVVLCPSTEANLGDGIFRLKDFQEEGGSWSIGTDSHIGLDPFEELRLLDYGQRLTSHERHTFIASDQSNPGLYAMNQTIRSGRKGMGNDTSKFFEVGQALNACIISAKNPLIANTSIDHILNTIIYAPSKSNAISTIVNGELISSSGDHIRREIIEMNFGLTMKSIQNR